MPDFIDRFGEPNGPNGEMVLSSSRQSIITSLLSAGTFVYVQRAHFVQNLVSLVLTTYSLHSGSLAQAFTADRFGRKGSIRIWSIIFTIGVVIQTATERSIAQITIGYACVLPSPLLN